MRWLWALPAALAVGCAAPADPASAPVFAPAPAPAGAVKAVFHVNTGDLTIQDNVLKNIAAAVGNLKEKAVLEVVCHSDGIDLLHKDRSAYPQRIEQLRVHGVRVVACGGTLRDRKIKPEELLPGIVIVPSATVEILTRQQEGYGYFKP